MISTSIAIGIKLKLVILHQNCNRSCSQQDIIELDGSLSSPPKKRKLSCQYENCFEIFDCQENLTAHIATTHSEGGLASFVNEHPSGHLAGASYLDSRVAAATGVSGLRKAPSNTSFSNINSTDSTGLLQCIVHDIRLYEKLYEIHNLLYELHVLRRCHYHTSYTENRFSAILRRFSKKRTEEIFGNTS